MKKIIKAIAAAAILSVATGCAAMPGPATDGQNMGWNAPNQNG